MKADYLIKNGLVFDCYRNVRQVEDVAIANGVIIDAANVTEAAQVVDASGCIVSPGLIDFHGHFSDTTSDLGANAEMICFPTGVTTIIDGGTTGVANYLGFRRRLAGSRLQMFALLHINPSGIATLAYHELQDPAYAQPEKMKQYMKLYGDQLIGLKVRQSKNLVGDMGLEPLKYLVKLAEEIGCFVAVHTTDPPCKIPELIKELRPGDVFCHVFQGRGNTIINENGKVYDEVWEAQKNGIVFDAANGKNHFSFAVAEAALAEGFKPDVISTDMSAFNAYTRRRVFSLPYIMSKYIMLGMDIWDIFRCVTYNPAKFLHQEKELGSLTPGTVANVAIHRLVNKETDFEDTFDQVRHGSQVLRTEMTIAKGWTVYRSIEI